MDDISKMDFMPWIPDFTLESDDLSEQFLAGVVKGKQFIAKIDYSNCENLLEIQSYEPELIFEFKAIWYGDNKIYGKRI